VSSPTSGGRYCGAASCELADQVPHRHLTYGETVAVRTHGEVVVPYAGPIDMTTGEPAPYDPEPET
jgi:hypothetical protein